MFDADDIDYLGLLLLLLLQSMVALKDFMLLLILFIFIFVVLGTQLFGGNPYYTSANTATWRKGFASFYESFYTVSMPVKPFYTVGIPVMTCNIPKAGVPPGLKAVPDVTSDCADISVMPYIMNMSGTPCITATAEASPGMKALPASVTLY